MSEENLRDVIENACKKVLDDDELEYCQILRYCTKIDELEKRNGNLKAGITNDQI